MMDEQDGVINRHDKQKVYVSKKKHEHRFHQHSESIEDLYG